MEFITSQAEQQACEHIRPYRSAEKGLLAAFFDLSRTPYAASGQRSYVKNFFAEELQDPEAIIFQFMNGDILVLSEKLATHHVLKAASRFGLDRYRNGKLYKLPRDYDEIMETLVGYVKVHEAAAHKDTKMGLAASARERFLDVKVGGSLPSALSKIRRARQKIKVLIIDDDEFALCVAQQAVGKDYEVETARSAVDGIKKYVHIAPNILFLDINMPGVSGHDFLVKIFDLDPEAFVVMVSGHSDQNTIQKVKRLGAQGFISKPYPGDEIERYIKQCEARMKGVDVI